MSSTFRRAAIVIAFDHLPVGFLGCYGAEQVATPQFDRIAGSGITFDACFAARTTIQAPAVDGPPPRTANDAADDADTCPASTCWTTLQRELQQHGIHADLHRESLAAPEDEQFPEHPEDLPLADLLEHCHDFIARQTPDSGLLWLRARGVADRHVPPRQLPLDLEGSFGIDADDPDVAPCLEAVYCLQDARRSDAPARHVQTLRDAGLMQRGRLPHTPALDRLNRALYAGGIRAIDACLTTVRDALEVPPERQPLLIITGMQGDSIGRHPQLQDGCPPLVDEIVHVPLIVRPPGGLALGQRCRALVQTGDIIETVRRWLIPDASPAPPVDDESPRDLLQVYEGGCSERTAVLLEGPDGCTGLRTADYALFVPGPECGSSDDPDAESARLFRKPEDICDMLNVSSQEPETVHALCEELRVRRQRTDQVTE